MRTRAIEHAPPKYSVYGIRFLRPISGEGGFRLASCSQLQESQDVLAERGLLVLPIALIVSRLPRTVKGVVCTLGTGPAGRERHYRVTVGGRPLAWLSHPILFWR